MIDVRYDNGPRGRAEARQMTPEAIERELVAALVEVRRLYDADEDTWREALTTTWIKLSQAIALDPELRVPLIAMQLEFRERRRESAGTPKPLRVQLPMVFAAAVVTVLKQREKMDITSAVAAVA